MVATDAGVSGARARLWSCKCSTLELSTSTGVPAPGRPPSIVVSRSRKLASRDSASAGVSVFFAGRLFWTQSGRLICRFEIAQFGDQSVAQGLRLIRGQHNPRRPDNLVLPPSGRLGERPLIRGRLRQGLNIETRNLIGVAAAPRSGASRSSSPAIPTRVNKAYRRAYVSAAPMRRGATVSAIGHTGHSDDSHSPEEWARVVVRRMSPASLSIAVV
jgi:hypothetical protein